MTKKITRSKTNRMLGGVAGGLAEYFDIDPTLVRILFVIVCVGWGAGLLAYLILWIVIPEVDAVNVAKEDRIVDVEPKSEQ